MFFSFLFSSICNTKIFSVFFCSFFTSFSKFIDFNDEQNQVLTTSIIYSTREKKDEFIGILILPEGLNDRLITFLKESIGKSIQIGDTAAAMSPSIAVERFLSMIHVRNGLRENGSYLRSSNNFT